MSLILEALKKLEREKQGPERGVVVLASAALADRAPARRPATALAAAVLALAAVGVVLAWWRPGPQPAPVPPAAPATRLAAEAAPAPITVAAPRVTVRPAEAAAPIVPAAPAAAPAEAPVLHLSAISVREGRPVAVINDEVVEVGDVVGGARVVAIGTTHVEVERDGRRRRLTF